MIVLIAKAGAAMRCRGRASEDGRARRRSSGHGRRRNRAGPKRVKEGDPARAETTPRCPGRAGRHRRRTGAPRDGRAASEPSGSRFRNDGPAGEKAGCGLSEAALPARRGGSGTPLRATRMLANLARAARGSVCLPPPGGRVRADHERSPSVTDPVQPFPGPQPMPAHGVAAARPEPLPAAPNGKGPPRGDRTRAGLGRSPLVIRSRMGSRPDRDPAQLGWSAFGLSPGTTSRSRRCLA